MSRPEPQLLAQVIAAFAANVHVIGDGNENPILFPCLTMQGTYPTFYKITITRLLKNAVSRGGRPRAITWVERFNPILVEGGQEMTDLDNRREVVRCLSAFIHLL